ncbi:hypothetical protein ACOSQ2_015635 [Xanthoceras sorbifolium]
MFWSVLERVYICIYKNLTNFIIASLFSDSHLLSSAAPRFPIQLHLSLSKSSQPPPSVATLASGFSCLLGRDGRFLFSAIAARSEPRPKVLEVGSLICWVVVCQSGVC